MSSNRRKEKANRKEKEERMYEQPMSALSEEEVADVRREDQDGVHVPICSQEVCQRMQYQQEH